MSATPNFHLLVVDDDPLLLDSLRMILPPQWRMTSCSNSQNLSGKMNFHAAFIDMHLSDSSSPEGPRIISQILSENAKTEIVAMSGDLSLRLMEDCLNRGAKKFLAKPLMAEEVIATLEKIEALWRLRQTEAKGSVQRVQLIGKSPAIEKVREQLASLRGEAGPILIEGPTGSGKEVIAQLLNQQELSRSFLAVNIASIPETLFESELFGHVKGAFTGAETAKIGLAEAAHGGDLFLDEIEALPLSQQVKLLRFLETGEVRKVGAKETQKVKARVIVATNQNLETLVKEGQFRADLFHRLNGKIIQLPPLKDRPSDIEELAPYFLSHLRPRSNKQFSPGALACLKKYSWPGNVRELKRICEQLTLTSPLPIIRPEDIEKLLDLGNNSRDPIDLPLGLAQMIERFEADVIRKTLQTTQDVDRAASQLKISRSNLYKKMKDYQIEVNG